MVFRSRRRSWAVVVIMASILAFFIYKAEKEGAQSPSTQPSEPSRQVITVGFDTKIQTADPRMIGNDANTGYLEQLCFLPLISFDAEGNLQLFLASSIEPSSRKSWTIHLKKGVHFANGSLITAHDVEATYHHILNPPKTFPVSPRRGAFADVVSFKATSNHTLEVVLKTPDASFLNNLVVGIMPADIVKNAAAGDVLGKGAESGPYAMTSYSDTEAILIKNQKYDFSTLPLNDEIHFRIITDTGTRYAALMKGDLDIVQNSLDPDKIQLLKDTMSKKFRVVQRPKLSTTYIAFNFKDPIAQNIHVRRAVAHAIDRETILKYRMHSDERPATGMFPEGNTYFDDHLPQISYSPVQARAHLERSLLDLPVPISLKLSNYRKANLEIAKAIVSNLNDVGFKAKIDVVENSVFQDQIRRGIAQAWYAPWVGFKDPDHLRFVFATNMQPPRGGNRGAFSDVRIDALLEKGRQTLNVQERKRIYDEAQELLAEQLPYVYLWHDMVYAVVKQSVEGFEPYADGRYWSLTQVVKK